MPDPLPADLLDRFAAIVGAPYALREAEAIAPYVSEPRDRFHHTAPLVLRPGSTAEVAAIVRLAHETATAVVPQGGNTGLVGGQVPAASGREVVVSLTRLNRIRALDAVNATITVEAGCVLKTVQDAADAAGFLFPLSLAAEGTCQIGGNLASNAGGIGVIAHGNARELCLGLEVVLADGEVWNGLKGLRKDNTGYDLKDLIIGSEGTLGIITAAVLKLKPRPRDTATALAAVGDPEAALGLLAIARRLSGNQVTAFELMARSGVEFTFRHAALRDPLAEPHPWYVLFDLAGQGEPGGLAEVAEAILAEGFEAGLVGDATIARSGAAAAELWRLREALPEVQRHEGGSIKHDVSVPVSAVPAFIDEACRAVVAMVPGCRPVPFGHVGDGNVHFNVSQPAEADKQAFLDRWPEMSEAVHAIATRLGGSISAEHGIGVLKREALRGVKSPVELRLMRGIKQVFDPKGILNPGKVVPADG